MINVGVSGPGVVKDALEGMEDATLDEMAEIIKRTHMFDKVDRIFGEPGAEYSAQPPGQEGGMGGGLGGGGGAPVPVAGDGFGDELGDLGEPGGETEGDIGGDEGGSDLADMGGAPSPLQESEQSLLTEQVRKMVAKGQFYNAYVKNILDESAEDREPIPILDKTLRVNEEIESILKSLDADKVKMKIEENIDTEEESPDPEIEVLLH